jgi:hypothetical protein
MIIIDNAGYQFIDGANESEYFKNAGVELKFFEFSSDKDGAEHLEQVKLAKRAYNKKNHSICFKQIFTSEFIRKANEHLQASIDHKKIWFASKITANGGVFDRIVSQNIDLSLVNAENMLDFIEAQDDLIHQTKKQCALVEVKSTPRGNQTFDLPLHLKRSTSAKRARKDNYTTLMLSNWAVKSYYDIFNFKEETMSTFTPRMIG